jgi:hypothetical protein
MFQNDFVKRSTSLAVMGVLLSLSTPAVFAQTQMQMSPTQQHMMGTTTPRQATYTIPTGTGLTVRPVGFVPANVGQPFTGQLVQPVTVDGVTVLPAGSQVRGTVVGVSPAMDTVQVQFREVGTATGEMIPIRATGTVPRLQAGVHTAVPAAGRPVTLFPRVTIGPEPANPAARVVAGTVGGAAFGAATGTLVGLVLPAVYDDDITFNEGTGAVRGLAWGAAMGAGLGLVTGLIGAAADRRRPAVTTAAAVPVAPRHGATNITTGSLQEIPVAYQQPATTTTTTDFTIILEQPATVRL